MKKTSTLAMSLLLAAGAWCGLAYAAEGDTTPETPSDGLKTATFDFNKADAYGMTPRTNDYEEDGFKFTEGDITVTLHYNGGSGARLWKEKKADDGYTFRVMNKSQIEFSIEKGSIEEITFTAKSDLTSLAPAEGTTLTAGKDNNATSATYTGSAKTMTFQASKTVPLTGVVVKYTDVEDTREKIEWRYYGDKDVQVILNDPQTYIYLPNPYLASDPWSMNGQIPYTVTSSNENVAVIENNRVTVVGVGQTEITTTVAETETYLAGSFSFNLTVLPEGTTFHSNYGADFTLDNPETAKVWTVSEAYNNMQANGYISGTRYEGSAKAISPELTFKANQAPSLDFDQAINFLKGNPVGDYLKIYVAEIEKEAGEEEEEQGPVMPYAEEAAEGEGEETPAELNWVEIEGAVTAPEADSDNYFANKTIDLSAYAGKTIKIAFEYTSNAEIAPRWRIQNINIVCADLLAEAKEAAVEEYQKYLKYMPFENPYVVQGLKSSLADADTEEAIQETLDYYIKQIVDQVYGSIEVNFTWDVDGKMVSYVEVPMVEDGIESIASAAGRNVIYDLQGRRVTNPTNGIFIVNGQKVVIKGNNIPAATAEADETDVTPETPETSEGEGEGEEGEGDKPVMKPMEGVSPWQLVEKFDMMCVFNSERVNERRWAPWAEGAEATEEEGKEEETPATRESNDDDAIMIQNVKTGLYLGQPTAAGEPIPSTADKAEAGYYVLKAIDGVIALADDATGLFVTFEPTTGATLSETPVSFESAELDTFGKDDDYKVVAEFPNIEMVNYSWVTTEITTAIVAVTPGVKPSGIGCIEVTSYDYKTGERVVYARITPTALATITPEKGEGHESSWGPNGPELTPFEADVYTIALREKITAGGEYNIEVAAGTFMVETEDGPLFSDEASFNVMIESTAAEEGWSPVVTPAEGTVTELETITIAPVEGEIACVVNPDFWNMEDTPSITLTKGEEVIKVWSADEVNDSLDENPTWENPDSYTLKLAEKITAAGTYTLTIPAGFFTNDAEAPSGETVITWVIE